MKRSRKHHPSPQQPMQPPPDPYDPYGDDMMYDPDDPVGRYGDDMPFGGLEGGGPHGPPGPSMEEMLAKAGFPKGMVNPYMRWK